MRTAKHNSNDDQSTYTYNIMPNTINRLDETLLRRSLMWSASRGSKMCQRAPGFAPSLSTRRRVSSQHPASRIDFSAPAPAHRATVGCLTIQQRVTGCSSYYRIRTITYRLRKDGTNTAQQFRLLFNDTFAHYRRFTIVPYKIMHTKV